MVAANAVRERIPAGAMVLSTLNHILKLLGGGEPTPDEREALFKETVLLVLARATDSDANIKPIEVDAVRGIVRKVTGEDVSAADVRVAAHSKIYEAAPLEKQLGRLARTLDMRDRVRIAQALAEVILADARVTSKETRFFNIVADSLELTPAALAGLYPAD